MGGWGMLRPWALRKRVGTWQWSEGKMTAKHLATPEGVRAGPDVCAWAKPSLPFLHSCWPHC